MVTDKDIKDIHRMIEDLRRTDNKTSTALDDLDERVAKLVDGLNELRAAFEAQGK